MNDVIQLVARAIYEASNHNKPYSLLTYIHREKCEREARAALNAMKGEWSVEMFRAFWKTYSEFPEGSGQFASWSAGLDAIVDVAVSLPERGSQ